MGLSVFDDAAALAFDFHASMLSDERRTGTYLEAILHTVRAGDIVLDIGAGTGVLSLFACLAGARRVYAVEHGPVLDLAKDLAVRNGFEDRIEFRRCWSTELELPEPVDVVVTETIGNMAFDEGIIAAVCDARERLLRPGGRIVPETVALVVAAVEGFDHHDQRERWRRPFFSLDFAPLRRVALHNIWDEQLDERRLISEPQRVAVADLAVVGRDDVIVDAELVSRRAGTVHALGCWFEAALGHGLELSNAPPSDVPSWSQGILPLAGPLSVAEGEHLRIRIKVASAGDSWAWFAESTGGGAVPAPVWQSTECGRLDGESTDT